MRSISIKAPGLSKGFARVKERLFYMANKLDEEVSDSAQFSLAMAQRIDMEAKITASVK